MVLSTWYKEETAQGGPETETAEEGSAEDALPEEAGEEDKSNGDRWDKAIGYYEDGPRKKARRSAARAAMEEQAFATPRHSEELHVLIPSTEDHYTGWAVADPESSGPRNASR